MTSNFHFNISLTVLNSLGRDLYRSVNTILGEAISNSWDADAHNVHIYINKEENYLIIKDDGIGMDAEDFQNKFLKIGYSKRNGGHNNSPEGRPYIGRKGIGKLALLSCSEKIHIITKTKDTDYIGAVIDNTQIDHDISADRDTNQHTLGEINIDDFNDFTNNQEHGTIIKFENLNSGIRNQIEFFKKVIALYYRFSLIDNDFNIYLNDELITTEELNDLVDDTQIFWMINDLKEDPLVIKLIGKDANKIKIGTDINNEISIKGFIASVEKPSMLKMRGVGEKLTIDLFVNGRLREKDILRHITSNRLYESYLYGQIHFDELDDEKDRFTSSREGIKADDEKFNKLLEELNKRIMPKIADEWDEIRLGLREDGDPDNPRKTPKQRKAQSLYNEVAKDYTTQDEFSDINQSSQELISTQEEVLVTDGIENTEVINLDNDGVSPDCIKDWVCELSEDAVFNVESYTECFVSENLIRKYINEKSITLSAEAERECANMKARENDSKTSAGISIDIRRNPSDDSYLDMANLANLVDKPEGRSYELSLSKKAKEYKPVRDAVMHTSLITDEAKLKLTTVYNDIKARLKNLFYNP